jgi:choline dehydrogenase-like flavoprotein
MKANFQIKETPDIYDVIVIGSGAGGGMAVYELTKAGAKVCLLEAGSHYDPADPRYITQMKWSYESPRRGAGSKLRPFGDFDASYGGWEIEGEPYTRAAGTDFRWFRSRMLGGRTNHWGRISLRFGPDDFRRKSIDGLGDDWPLSYEEVAPYYDAVDRLIGVFGSVEKLPNDPDSIFLPPPAPRLHELLIQKSNKRLGITTIPSRLSILTKKINERRGECYYCAQCGRACMAYADFSSSSCLCKPASETQNLDTLYYAMAREILTDPRTGLATGVSYVDTQTLEEKTVHASCSIPDPPASPTDWPTPPASSANTCTIPPAPPAADWCPCSWIGSATTRMAWGGCTFTPPGGWTTANWISPAATTLNTGVA